jgi:dephospho-CoA kinase
MVIGLTGGIGCGKSAVAALLKEQGFVVVDSDQLSHQALNEPDVIAQLVKRWGRDCLGVQGLPDRKWIGKKVFADTKERQFLESVLHPRIALMRQEIIQDKSRSYVVEIPLLFELGMQNQFDATVCVMCSDEVRLGRLKSRGLSREQAQLIINSQMPLHEKVKLADFVIFNDGGHTFLESEVMRLTELLRGRPSNR